MSVSLDKSDSSYSPSSPVNHTQGRYSTCDRLKDTAKGLGIVSIPALIGTIAENPAQSGKALCNTAKFLGLKIYQGGAATTHYALGSTPVAVALETAAGGYLIYKGFDTLRKELQEGEDEDSSVAQDVYKSAVVVAGGLQAVHTVQFISTAVGAPLLSATGWQGMLATTAGWTSSLFSTATGYAGSLAQTVVSPVVGAAAVIGAVGLTIKKGGEMAVDGYKKGNYLKVCGGVCTVAGGILLGAAAVL